MWSTTSPEKSVYPGEPGGRVRAVPSKSALQRAIALSMLSDGPCDIKNHRPLSDDSQAALGVAASLGAKIDGAGDTLRIEPVPCRRGTGALTADCGESGLCLRMFTPICALWDGDIELRARGTLLHRPVEMMRAPLEALNARFESREGRPPVHVRGPLRGGEVTVDGSITSQFLTGLLMAAPLCERDSIIEVPHLKSRPYVMLTLSLMEHFGVRVEHDASMTRFEIKGGRLYRSSHYSVEGDWSCAAFLLVAGATAGDVAVSGLDPQSTQADIAILEALDAAGADCTCEQGSYRARKSKLRGFEFDATDCPDLFPPLVCLALACEGSTALYGAQRLRDKESDRAAALAQELGALGCAIEVDGDRMTVQPGTPSAGRLDARGDHRIAMAAAIAASRAKGPVRIAGAACVAKSHPGFFVELQSLGIEVS